MTTKSKKKSPLTDRPLRNPGESLEEKLRELADDEVMPSFLIAIFLVVMAFMEWVRWAQEMPPQPLLVSVIALAAVGWATIKFRRGLIRATAIKQGRDGEKAVGQFLERLRESGAQVFHDVPAKAFNLDHVVIHTTGIYVVETKTYSKPAKGEATITFDGSSIKILGQEPISDPVVQVKAAAKWLADLLKESTGQSFKPRPVVVFPGWYIQPTAEAKRSDVWVLNPKALPAFIDHSKPQLQPEQVKLAAYHLSRYVRSV